MSDSDDISEFGFIVDRISRGEVGDPVCGRQALVRPEGRCMMFSLSSEGMCETDGSISALGQ